MLSAERVNWYINAFVNCVFPVPRSPTTPMFSWFSLVLLGFRKYGFCSPAVGL